MPVQQAQQLSRGPVVGDRVGSWTQADEVVAALAVGVEAAAQVHVWLRGVLLLVEAVGSGVPDVDLGVGDGFVGREVGDGAVHVRFVAALVGVDYGVTKVAFGGAVPPEGAEDLGRLEKGGLGRWDERDLTAVAVG